MENSKTIIWRGLATMRPANILATFTVPGGIFVMSVWKRTDDPAIRPSKPKEWAVHYYNEEEGELCDGGYFAAERIAQEEFLYRVTKWYKLKE